MGGEDQVLDLMRELKTLAAGLEVLSTASLDWLRNLRPDLASELREQVRSVQEQAMAVDLAFDEAAGWHEQRTYEETLTAIPIAVGE